MHTHPVYLLLYILAAVCFLLVVFDISFTHGPGYNRRAFGGIQWLALGLLFGLLPSVFTLAQN